MLHEILPAGDPTGEPILEIDNIHLSFAGLKAIDGVSLSVKSGELFAIIGPNGAGKTSIFNCISGVYHPQEGSIAFQGQSLLGMRPDRIADLGIARTFQNIELFPQMTVLDNLMLGRHQQSSSSSILLNTAARSWRCSRTGSKNEWSWAERWRWNRSC
jgi:branched-chain amino acid transport system ATP-binding protein